MNNNTKTLLTLVAGAVAGAATALLLTPTTGEEARRTIRRTASRVKDDLNDTLQQGMDKINNLRGTVNHVADEASSVASTATGRKQTASTGNTTGI